MSLKYDSCFYSYSAHGINNKYPEDKLITVQAKADKKDYNYNKEEYDIGDAVVISPNDKVISYCFDTMRLVSLCGQVRLIEDKITVNNHIFYLLRGEKVLVDDRCILGLKKNDYIAPPQKLVYSCEFCGRYYVVTNGESLPQADSNLCENCRKRLMVLPYHRFEPQKEFYSTEEDEDNPLFLGIELEVDEGGESSRTVSQIMPIMNKEEGKFFIYCSHDGSLNDGFEIITQPATYNYHQSVMPLYDKMFKDLISKGYQSHNTSTCGIHIHFNRSFYQDNETLYTTKLLYLVEKFWEDIVIFSRRSKKRLDRYAKKIDDTPTRFLEQWDKTCEHDGHYYAINLTNCETIEFRMFRGTLNLNSFQSILSFVKNCIEFAKTKPLKELQAMNFEDLLDEKGKQYFSSRKAIMNYETE